MAFANIAGVISGASERLISRSRIASRRGKSVCDLVEIALFFIVGGLSGRDDTNNVGCFSVSHDDDARLQQAQGQIARLAIIKALVNDSDGIPREDGWHVDKVDAMFEDIGLPLVFFPLLSPSTILLILGR